MLFTYFIKENCKVEDRMARYLSQSLSGVCSMYVGAPEEISIYIQESHTVLSHLQGI